MGYTRTTLIALGLCGAIVVVTQAQKINGWYSCNLRTFATPTPAPASPGVEVPNSSEEEKISIRGGWSLKDPDNSDANSIFRSLLVNSASATPISTGASGPIAECAEFTMPLCHAGICDSNSTVKVFVKRMRAQTKGVSPTKSLWVLQGGPGASSVNMEGIMAALYDSQGSSFGGSVDVYTMDHRGTGRSSRLSCGATQIETSGSPTQGSITTSNFPTCFQDINTQLGDEGDVNLLKGYSTTSAATDLSTMISLLDKSTLGQTYVYGVSYGTYLVERLMQLNNPKIKGYVLDGVVSQSGSKQGKKLSFADWAVNMNEIASDFLTLCAKDPQCSSRFPSGSALDTLKSLLTQMDKAPKSNKCFSVLNSISNGQTPPSYYVRSLLGQILQSQTLRSFIPAIIYRLSRCNNGDAIAIINFFNVYYSLISQPDEADTFDSSMLYNLVALSELFTYPTPSRSSVRSNFLNSAIASDTSNLVTYYCLASGGLDPACALEAKNSNKLKFIYPTDIYFDKPITIPEGTTVLLMSGLLDPQTPPKYARYQFDSFIGSESSKKLIEFPTSAHGTILNTPVTLPNKIPCGATIVSNYVTSGLANLDTSCLAYIAPLSFNITSSISQRLMGTSDAYDGTPEKMITTVGPSPPISDPSSSSDSLLKSNDQVSSSWRGVAIAGIVAAVLLVGGIVFLVIRLRRQRELSKAPPAVDYVAESHTP